MDHSLPIGGFCPRIFFSQRQVQGTQVTGKFLAPVKRRRYSVFPPFLKEK